MLRNRDDLYSADDYQPITDEHFIRRACKTVEEVQDDEPDDNEDWRDIQAMFH